MVVCNGIETYVARHEDRVRYNEYTASPESPSHTGKQNEVFIEAVTGECFEVSVQPTTTFDFQRCEAVRISCTIDGGARKNQVLYAKSVQASFTSERPIQRQRTFGTSRELVDGKWVLSGFAFTELALGKQSSNFSALKLEANVEQTRMLSRMRTRSPEKQALSGA